MWQNFFKHIDIQPENAHVLDGNAADIVKECDNFEKQIKEAGGIELFVGGRALLLLHTTIQVAHFKIKRVRMYSVNERNIY